MPPASALRCSRFSLKVRVPVLLPGLLFATGRRTVASWFRAAAVGKHYRA